MVLEGFLVYLSAQPPPAHGALIRLWARPLMLWDLASLTLCFLRYTVGLLGPRGEERVL